MRVPVPPAMPMVVAGVVVFMTNAPVPVRFAAKTGLALVVRVRLLAFIVCWPSILMTPVSDMSDNIFAQLVALTCMTPVPVALPTVSDAEVILLSTVPSILIAPAPPLIPIVVLLVSGAIVALPPVLIVVLLG